MFEFKSCIVVGGGISGLVVAQRLRERGVAVTLLDKGRRVGGRMATREAFGATFDHGAQFVTTRERLFREMVESWLEHKAVKPWYKGPLGNMRYVGAEGMFTIPQLLAKGLDVHVSTKVTDVAYKNDTWTVKARKWGEDGVKTYKADFLVMTLPVPQILELFEKSRIDLDYDEEEELKKIVYTKCLTVLARLDGPAGLPNPGAVDLNHPILRWIGDNSVKGIAGREGCVTINSSMRFADVHWDTPDEQRIPLMLKAAKPFLRSEVVEASLHRWGFSEPVRIYREKQPFRQPYFLDEDMRLAMCGDGFGGPRIEASAMSAILLSEKLTSPL